MKRKCMLCLQSKYKKSKFPIFVIKVMQWRRQFNNSIIFLRLSFASKWQNDSTVLPTDSRFFRAALCQICDCDPARQRGRHGEQESPPDSNRRTDVGILNSVSQLIRSESNLLVNCDKGFGSDRERIFLVYDNGF
jgi:hypothetical protein